MNMVPHVFIARFQAPSTYGASEHMQSMTQPLNKRATCGALLEYADAEQIDIKAIAEAPQITPQHVGAYLKNLNSGPNTIKELLKAAYDEPVIPGWLHRPGRVDLVGAGRTTLRARSESFFKPKGRPCSWEFINIGHRYHKSRFPGSPRMDIPG